MSIHTKLVTRGMPLLIAAAAGMAWLGAGAPARAADTSSAVVNLTGTVAEASENVNFGGTAVVTSRLARDPDFNRPTLVLTFDFGSEKGVGANSQRTYVVPTPTIVQRRLAPSHVVEVSIPYVERGKSGLSAKSAVATFNLSFDVTTGAITQATGSVAKSPF